MKKELTFSIPREMVESISRRRNGRPNITKEEILEAATKMSILYYSWEKTTKDLDYCEGEWWDKMRVESHFKKSRWYYAHRKRKALINKQKDLHKKMFYLLLATDGMYEQFDSGSLSAQEVFDDFQIKYVDKLSTVPSLIK